MKRFLMPVLLIAVLALASLCRAETGNVGNDTELIGFLRSLCETQSSSCEIYYSKGYDLYENYAELNQLILQNGIDSFEWSFIPGKRKVELSSLEYSVNPVFCDSCADVRDMMMRLSKAQGDEYTLYVGKYAFEQLSGNDFELLHSLETECGIKDRSLSYSTSSYKLCYSGIVYYDDYAYAASIEGIRNALAAFGMNGYSGFTLGMDKATFGALSADNFKLYRQLESEFRIKDSSISYYASACIIVAKDISYLDSGNECSNVSELMNVFRSHASKLDTTFTLSCSPELYAFLKAEDFETVSEIASTNGVYLHNMSTDDGHAYLIFSDMVYYPSTLIYGSYINGTLSELSSDEVRTFNAAAEIINRVYEQAYTELDVEILLHDELCGKVRYYAHDSDGFNLYDTAIGALVYGMADCDGYADAYYLLLRLAGFDAGYVHGSSVESIAKTGESSHMWNTVNIAGRWYFTDVTWDDQDEAGYISHRWFNKSANEAAGSYIWDPDTMNVQLAQQPYRGDSYFEARGLVFADFASAADYAVKQALSCEFSAEVMVLTHYVTDEEVGNRISEAVGKANYYGAWQYSWNISAIGQYSYVHLTLKLG